MPAPLFFPSGDFIADRRYGYARDYLLGGDRAAAADLLEQAVERVPGFACAWFLLGDIREALSDRSGAAAAYRQAADADPEDRHGATLRLARLGETELVEMPRAYLRALFDQYAPKFDRALIEDLGYRGPELLYDAVMDASAATGRAPWFDRALDLGCGTGLVGAAFWKRVDAFHAVDLSPVMVAFARRRGCYADVQAADMLDYLSTNGAGSADLVVAADTLIYVGELAPLFAAVVRALRSGGLFAFTLETHAGEGAVLGAKMRYAHAAAYVRGRLAGAGLRPVIFRAASARFEADEPVPGLVVVAVR